LLQTNTIFFLDFFSINAISLSAAVTPCLMSVKNIITSAICIAISACFLYSATLNLSSDYNTNTRELTLTVNGRSLEDEAYITVIITQNGIEAPQYGAPDNYQHNHAPRAFLTSAIGDKLALDANGNYSTTFNYTIPNKVGNFECIPENIEVIVFIHGDINKEVNRIVYNADYKKLSELIK
jgi:hypothetical protein